MPLVPFGKSKSAKPVMSKRDPMPRKISGAAKSGKSGGQSRDPFKATATDMAPRMARQVRGK